ncbi:MAG: FAD-binding protein, partial [Bacteroidetes bacterium]|nr:FAD-binding protein [Bacteroidota bacterium]
MPQICNLNISPDLLDQTDALKKIAARQLKIQVNQITGWKVVRRSIDSRKKTPRYVLRVEVWVNEPYRSESFSEFPLQNVATQAEVHIVGLGPAGLFAALHLIRLGYKPIVWERGKSVRERRRDLVKITREGEVNPDSNYCFGEGGAGTFSDGKLYTRSTKRGDTREVLEALVQFGATPDILVDAHPHIGTNKLPGIIQNMREKIIECGGEIHFNSRVTGIFHQQGAIHSIEINGQEKHAVSALILATGHSARDIFELLHHAGIHIEAKSFALGVRVEHPQNLIDQIQYHCQGERHPNLPAASYSLVKQVGDKGVYSFCMCPGGIICPAATQNDEVVVNGWSPSKRNSPFANSGMVVEVALTDLIKPGENPL